MDLSNKTLALLLVVTLVVSMSGTLLSLSRLESAGKSQAITTTGNAADQGNVTLEINSTASLIFIVRSINFGSGLVNSTGGFDNCTMDSYGNIARPNCVGFTTVSEGLVVENDGSQNLSVQLRSSESNESLIGGSLGGGPRFEWNISNNDTRACLVPLFTANGTFVPVNTSAPGTLICGDLNYNQNDSLRIHVRINIPQNSLSGQRNATFIATGSPN
jgi:hypothetical protein